MNGIQQDIAHLKDTLQKEDFKPDHPKKRVRSLLPPPPTEILTGREKELQYLGTNFMPHQTSVTQGRQRRFVLYGLGGMGKTQTALKFLHDNRER